MRTIGRQVKQEKKKQRSYIVEIQPAEFRVNASSRSEAVKEAKKAIFKNGLAIFLDFAEEGEEWDLAGLFSGAVSSSRVNGVATVGRPRLSRMPQAKPISSPILGPC